MSTAAGNVWNRPDPQVTPSPPTDQVAGRSDAQVIKDSEADPSEFAQIFDRHSDEIHSYATRRLGPDLGHADDVTAETFVIAFRKRDRYDPRRADARPWLYGIVGNLIAGHRRSEVRRLKAIANSHHDLRVEEEERIAERVSATSLRPALAAALARLSAAERELILLVAWADLSYEETAGALKIPVGTVRSRLHRVRTKLRRHLGMSGEPSS